jgi:uncharacterized protein
VGVLDFHIHLGRREHLTPRFIRYFENKAGAPAVDLLEAITPRAFVEFLEGQGVDRAVILAEYSPHVTGIIPNEFVAEFAAAAGSIIPFGSVDLQSPEPPAAQVERCLTKLGCRGVKLYPSYDRFYPDDPRLLPVYEIARDLGVPVMFHTGTSLFPGTRIRYANPLLLDDIAEDFQGLAIVMCHAGRPFWYKEAEWMLRRHKSVHVDVSGIPPKQLPHIFPKMESMADRFIFGSDWPDVPSIGRQVERVRQLPLSSNAIRAVLWENGARLLRLDS